MDKKREKKLSSFFHTEAVERSGSSHLQPIFSPFRILDPVIILYFVLAFPPQNFWGSHACNPNDLGPIRLIDRWDKMGGKGEEE